MSMRSSVWPTRFRCWSTAVSLRRARRRKYGGTGSSCGLISAKVRPSHERGVTAARAAASAGAVLRVRPQPGPVRGRPDGSRGRNPRAAGAQRHGQDDPRAFGGRADQTGAGAHRVRRAIDHGRRAAPGRARGHRTGARRPAGVREPERAGTPDRIPPRRDRAFAALDAGAPVRAVPAPGRTPRPHGRPAFRRRAADAGDRQGAGHQPAAADPGRSDRGTGAPSARGGVARAGYLAAGRPRNAGDRQVRASPDRACRSPRHSRKRARGVDRQLPGAGCGSRPLVAPPGTLSSLLHRLAIRQAPGLRMKPVTSVWIRRLAIAVGALALVLVAATAVLLATFDANRYKALAIEWMRTEHQRTLEIDGPIKLSFFPRLSVQVSRVRLSERGRSDEFAAIGEAALAVQVLPLLRKQLVIGRVSARDVHAAYLRDARGARNIDDLVSRNAAPDAGASPSGGPAMHFDVSGVELDNLRLQVRDEVARLAGDLEVLSFSSGRLANQAESPVSLRATALLTQPEALKLSVDGRTTLMLDLDRNSVALSRMKLDVTGETASVKALSLALEGALAWDGGALRAGPLQVTLKGATLGTTSLTPSTLQVKRALLNPAGKRLELESLDLALAGRRGADPFEVSIRWPRLAVDGRKVESSPLSGRVKVAGQSGLEGQIRSAAPTGSFDALRVPGLELTLAGSSGQRKIDGTAKADMLIDAGRGAATFERVDLHATLADPGLQPLKLVVQGSGGADTKAATWKLNGSINANRFETK